MDHPSVLTGRIASGYASLLATEAELLAATKKAPPAKKKPGKRKGDTAVDCPPCERGTLSAPKKASICTCETCPNDCKPKKKKTYGVSPEAISGWSFPAQPRP